MTTTKQQWQRIPRSNCVSTQLSLLQSFTYYHQSVLIQRVVYNCGHTFNEFESDGHSAHSQTAAQLHEPTNYAYQISYVMTQFGL